MNIPRLTILFVSLAFLVRGQLSSYSYYRELTPVSETAFYNLNISSSILDRPGNFRIYKLSDKDTIEVPHVSGSRFFEVYDQKYLKPLRIIDKSFEPGKNSYATLIVDTGITYNSIYVNFNASEFFKDVTVEGSNDNKSWKTIVENEKIFHYYREPGDYYYRNKINLGDVSFKYLRLKTDDSNGEKLDLVSASLPLVKEEIIEEDEVVPFELKRSEDKKNKQTILECAFQRRYLITAIDFDIDSQNNFRREASIHLKDNANATKENWVYFGNTVLSSASSNKLYLNNYNSGDDAFKSDKMRILINNLDNQPLESVGLKIFTHHEKIKVKLEKNVRYVLAYGKDNDQLPQYDLEYFRNAIPLNLTSTGLGLEKQIEHKPLVKPEPLLKNKLWIWIALTVCVLVIGIFTIRLLKADNKDPQE
jgi:hypothetical protein